MSENIFFINEANLLFIAIVMNDLYAKETTTETRELRAVFSLMEKVCNRKVMWILPRA